MLSDGQNDKPNYGNHKSISIDLSKIPEGVSKIAFTLFNI
jgi:stress response protein SCP2